MAYKKKTEEKEKTYFNIEGMTVTNCRVLSDNVLAFTLTGNGLGLYNLRVVDSKNGKFIGAPQSKGKDGNWYNQYALYLTDEDQEKIIAEVEKQLKL